ncbi:MAG TPA: membrane protein insertion efficiency factor YidD [Candidatus Paceibacterota bacterium]|nr:membrane protein insertion efficiency factor YidD [Candidatus Paceibacterota bacterium]
MRDILVKFIRFYQRFSHAAQIQSFPLFAHSACRQWPTCSEYAIDAVRRYGPARGLLLATRRVARCNPFARVHA